MMAEFIIFKMFSKKAQKAFTVYFFNLQKCERSIYLDTMRSPWVGVNSDAMAGFLLREGDTGAHGEKPCEDRAEVRVMQLQAKDCWQPPEAGTRQRRILLRIFGGSMTLPTS